MRDQQMKADQGKLMLELIPVSAYEGLGEVLTYGAEKYEPNGWKQVEPERYVGALLRHFTAYLNGEVFDKESGLRHIDQVMCNAMFLSHFERSEPECTGGIKWTEDGLRHVSNI